MLLGDFNCVLKDNEMINGCLINFYKVKTSEVLCSSWLIDMVSFGYFYTWINNSICSKLDRVIINNSWRIQGFEGQAMFLPSGCLSNHSSAMVSLFHQMSVPKRPFKFFNIWLSIISSFPLFMNSGRKVHIGLASSCFAGSLRGLLRC